MRKRIVDKREKKREPRERKTAEMTFGFQLSLLFSRFSTINILLFALCFLLCPKPAPAANITWTQYTGTANGTTWPYTDSWNQPWYDPVAERVVLPEQSSNSGSIYANALFLFNTQSPSSFARGFNSGTTNNVCSSQSDSSTVLKDRHYYAQGWMDTKRDLYFQVGGNCGGQQQDMYYFTGPSFTNATQLLPTTLPLAATGGASGDGGQASCAYDSIHDAAVCTGYDGGNATHPLWKYCSTIGNPGGALTSAQTADGFCDAGSTNNWEEFLHGSSWPGNRWSVGFVYDSVNRKFVMWGGATNTWSNTYNEVWTYDPATNAIAGPLAGSSSCVDDIVQPGMIFNPNKGLVMIHTTTNEDCTYSVATQTWGTVSSNNGGPTQSCGNCDGMAYDVANDALVYWRGSQTTGGDIWVGALGSSSLSPDTTPPTISITAPTAAMSLSGTVSITVSAADPGVPGQSNSGVANVQFQLDGNNLGSAVTSSPYSMSWDTTQSANGSHTLTAIATDTAGNSATALSVIITVSNTSGTPPLGSGPVGNGITISEQDGVATTNYPIQVGRPFVQGDIRQYPQAVINGVAVPTQADVKTRWLDGSVKHAIISFLIPNLPANGTASIVFQNQSSNNNTAPTQAQMLAPAFNFDAHMVMTNGITATPSARQVLTDWDGSTSSDLGPVKLWTQGPIATTVILADHSTTRKYDVGSDSNRSFRPIFHATFWPGINKVRVRFIGEIANTTSLQDQNYDLALTVGQSNPQTVYTKTGILHTVLSRWTKEFWIGGAPSHIAMNPNLAYLVKTKFMASYDTSKIMPESAIASESSNWTGATQDLYDAGNWQPVMGNPGGRQDIGPYPTWSLDWVYSGDFRLQQMAFGNADLAAAWPMHIREGVSGRFFDRAHTTSALGRVLSNTARPTTSLASGFSYPYTVPADQITFVGATAATPWQPDGAHQPDPFVLQYMLSGDYWYLEEMQFWAAYSAATYNGAATTVSYGRGPTGAEGGIQDQVRGDAWIFRSRVETALLSPDNSPEQSYFNTLINDAIALWEGKRNITGTQFQGTTNWTWQNAFIRSATGSPWEMTTWPVSSTLNLGVPPLGNWEAPNTDSGGNFYGNLDHTTTEAMTQEWMEAFLIMELGRAKELGYPTDALLKSVAPHLIGQLTDPGYNPYLSATYETPTVSLLTNAWFTNWADAKSGYISSFQTLTTWPDEAFPSDLDQSYALIIRAAASYLPGLTAGSLSGNDAWNWAYAHVLNDSLLNTDPKWAILPRLSVPPSQPPTNPPPVPVNPGQTLSVRVYPNPWRSDKHAGHARITFDGLVANTTINLFTVSGHKVKNLSTSESKIDWDLTNDSGDKVASGVYLYVIADSAGDKVKGKVAVIK